MIEPKDTDDYLRVQTVMVDLVNQLRKLYDAETKPEEPDRDCTNSEWTQHRQAIGEFFGRREGLSIAMHLISQNQRELYAALRDRRARTPE